VDKQAEVFELSVPEADIADLRQRLEHTRLPDQAPGPAWAYGTDVEWIRGLIEYWRNDFDWRAEEARLNAFTQYKVRLDDIDLHFLHVKGEGSAPCPLLLSHGWPGSALEFLKLIPMLTDQANSAAILLTRSRSWRHHYPDTACHFRRTSPALEWRKLLIASPAS
jgi:hypothetical protein